MTKLVSLYLRGFCALFLLTFSFIAYAEEPVFQFVRAVGDERENYFFTRSGGIAISDKKDIFFIDKDTFSLRKFDWNGAFIARTGKKGRGPGDFIKPSGPKYFNNKIYIFDWLNRRIAITGVNLEKFDYIMVRNLKDRDGRMYAMRNDPIVLDDNRFLGVNQIYSREKGRLFTFDRNQRVTSNFFCQLPTDLEDELWRLEADRDKQFLFNYATYPVVGVNHEKKQILITFEKPDITMHFYLYSLSGELIRTFDYRLDEKFRFPMEQLDGLKNTPPHSAWVLDILACGDYYLLFMQQITNRNSPDKKIKNSYLFINQQGEVVHRQEEKVRYLAATADGYLAGIKWDKENDLLKIIISKLNTARLSKMKPLSAGMELGARSME